MVKDEKMSWKKCTINYLRLTLVNALTNNEQYIFTAFIKKFNVSKNSHALLDAL